MKSGSNAGLRGFPFVIRHPGLALRAAVKRSGTERSACAWFTIPRFSCAFAFLFLFAFPLHARTQAMRDTSLWHASQLRIHGTKTVSNRDLRSVLRLNPSLFHKPIFSRRGLRTDSTTLVQVYQSFGFLKATVTLDPLIVNNRRKTIRIAFRINEGPRTRISSVVFQSNDSLLTQPILKKLLVKPGAPLMAILMQQDVQNIERWLGDRGFLQPRTGYAIEPKDDSLFATIRYIVRIGPQIHVQSIVIDNPPSVRKTFISHQLTFKKGKVLTLPAIRMSTNNLYATDLFRLALISYDSIGVDSAGLLDSAWRIVRVKTQPREFFSMNVGAGYKTYEMAIGNLSTSYSNFFGLGIRGSLAGYASFIQQRAEIGFAVPWVLLLPLDFDTRAAYGHQREDLLNFERTFAELQTSLAIRWSHASNLVATHRLQTNNITRSSAPDSLGRSSLNSIGLTWSLDRRNDAFNPSKGYSILTSTEWSGLFGSERFVKQEADLRGYVGIFGTWVASGAVRAGIAVPYGSSGGVPLQERFFLGGFSVMRGFGEKELGPADTAGHPTGGNLYLAVNVLELRYPIYKWFFGALFFDAGNLWDVFGRSIADYSSTFTFNSLPMNAGLGFQMQTPVIIVGAEAGFKLNPLHGQSPYALHLMIGQAF